MLPLAGLDVRGSRSGDGIEGGIEQALHEAIGRVVAAGGLAFVAGELGKGEPCAVAADLRGQREEARAIKLPANAKKTKAPKR